MSSSLDRLFVCTRCKKPVTVKVIKGTTKLIVIGKCPNRHGKRFTLSLSDLNDWAPILDSHFFKCIRCNTPITFKTLLKGPWAKVVITCPTHGKNDTRILPKVVYTALSTGKKEDKYEPPSPTTPSIPTCQYCGESTQVSYISQYSRYFCYKCERYIEDQKVVEKVRSTPEMDELKIKIKNLAEKIDKNLPHAICELPAALNMPHIDSSRIESILLDMILKGELNGELDPATEEITFLDAPIVSTAVSTPTDKTTTPQVCTRCGSELQYVEAKSAYFCKKCFEYTARTPTAKPSAIEAVRDFDYVGGQVRFKVAIRNKSKLVITNIGVELDIPAEFLLVRILPEASLDDIDRGLSKIDKLMPNSSQGIDYYLEPVACGTGVISGIAKFQDAEGNYNSTPVKSREIA
ncbi:MAG: hypothetical protein HWN66_20170, partial [Candidatus Helarchaeota archaeon]|nr:hypothetical protein [Candidatus Helarchaeota archaeon]